MLKYLIFFIITGLFCNAYADNISKNIRLDAGQNTLQITLPANSSTGYQWYIQTYNHNLLTLQNYHYAVADSNLAGSSGNAVFSFDINPQFYNAPQISLVSFVYQRPWTPGQDISTATITISSNITNTNSISEKKYSATKMNHSPAVSNDDSAHNWISLPRAAGNS